MMQFRYLDKRLKFADIAPYLTQIYGGQNAHELIWTPTVYVANERTSAVMGNGVKDLLISISSYGMVILNTRYLIFNYEESCKRCTRTKIYFNFFIFYSIYKFSKWLVNDKPIMQCLLKFQIGNYPQLRSSIREIPIRRARVSTSIWKL